jgi:hypothetical protein
VTAADRAVVAPADPVRSAAPSPAALGSADPAAAARGGPAPARRPLYPRLLRLRAVHPNAWQRALLGEGALAIAVLLVLADLATAWTLLVLPLAVAAVVKAHDLLAGILAQDSSEDIAEKAAEDPAEDPAEAPTTP